MAAKYKRVLLKLSGEALMGDTDFGISTDVLNYVAGEVKQVVELGMELSLVIGQAISSEGLPVLQRVWTEALLIIWVCWEQ